MWWRDLIRPSLLPFGLGALTYGVLQFLLYRWDLGWFLGEGRAIVATFSALAVSTMGYVLVSRRTVAPAMISALALSAGAWVAMTVWFAVIGFTNIFPILLALGALLLSAGAITGGLAACLLRGVWSTGSGRAHGLT